MAKAKPQADLADVVAQLKITNRLLVSQLKQTGVPQNELVVLLSDTGASNQQIADALGATADTVRTTLRREIAKRERNKPKVAENSSSEGEGA